MAASTPEFLRDERFINEHRKIFVMIMGRDSYAEEMANDEFPRLRQIMKMNGCPIAYCRMQRTGSRFALDRRKKMKIAEIYHNEGNHACFGYCNALGIAPEQVCGRPKGSAA